MPIEYKQMEREREGEGGEAENRRNSSLLISFLFLRISILFRSIMLTLGS